MLAKLAATNLTGPFECNREIVYLIILHVTQPLSRHFLLALLQMDTWVFRKHSICCAKFLGTSSSIFKRMRPCEHVSIKLASKHDMQVYTTINKSNLYVIYCKHEPKIKKPKWKIILDTWHEAHCKATLSSPSVTGTQTRAAFVILAPAQSNQSSPVQLSTMLCPIGTQSWLSPSRKTWRPFWGG